jgi:tartrate dehydratase alpha subunit/fumarate hydratase class I-like protein
MTDLTDHFVELIRRAATDLPPDVEQALVDAKQQEEPGSAAESALEMILRNVALARAQSTPVCQDTGTPIFEIYHPVGVSTSEISSYANQACIVATERSYLRPNAVDSLTGKNNGAASPSAPSSCSKAAAVKTSGHSTSCLTASWAPPAIWRVYARLCSMPSIRHRAKGARPVSSVSV